MVLKGAPARPGRWWVWRALWAAGALTGDATIFFVGWPLIEKRAFDLNAAAGPGDPVTPALMQSVLAFGSFGLVGLVAIALCWRRRGIGRVAVLLWPLVMLATPEAARLLQGPWIWMACAVLGVIGAVILAGPDPASRRDLHQPSRS